MCSNAPRNAASNYQQYCLVCAEQPQLSWSTSRSTSVCCRYIEPVTSYNKLIGPMNLQTELHH